MATTSNGYVKSVTSTRVVRRWIGSAVRWSESLMSRWILTDEAHDLLLTVSHIIADGLTAFSLRWLVEARRSPFCGGLSTMS
jgi:hypothetical protein